jgi:hypothetical protein
MLYKNKVCVTYHCISAGQTADLIIIMFLNIKSPKFDFMLAQWVSDMNCAKQVS